MRRWGDRRALAVRHRRPVPRTLHPARGAWDHAGMHTPCYVRGEVAGVDIERIYYAGRATARTTGRDSRYAIGYLERRHGVWTRGPSPVVRGDAQRPSALEPRVIHSGGLWRMWFLSAVGEVGRGEQPDYELRYCESRDGVAWGGTSVFSTRDEGFFDNVVHPHRGRWEMILARGTNLHGTTPFPSQGLWWTASHDVPGRRAHWSAPTRMINTDRESRPWFAAGVCGPSFVREAERDGAQAVHVFVTGTRRRTSWPKTALRHMVHARIPPVPAPYYPATGRLTFTAPAGGGMPAHMRPQR